MTRRTKIALVVGGYAAALLASLVAGWLYDRRMSAMPYDTSGGMYAAGEALTSTAVFLVLAVVPTLLGLWFARRHAGLWKVVALASVAFATVGLVAVLVPLVRGATRRNPVAVAFELLWLSQMLAMPFWAAMFGLFMLIAPTREARRLLLAAVGLELVIGVCALVHWFVPRSPL